STLAHDETLLLTRNPALWKRTTSVTLPLPLSKILGSQDKISIAMDLTNPDAMQAFGDLTELLRSVFTQRRLPMKPKATKIRKYDTRESLQVSEEYIQKAADAIRDYNAKFAYSQPNGQASSEKVQTQRSPQPINPIPIVRETPHLEPNFGITKQDAQKVASSLRQPTQTQSHNHRSPYKVQKSYVQSTSGRGSSRNPPLRHTDLSMNGEISTGAMMNGPQGTHAFGHSNFQVFPAVSTDGPPQSHPQYGVVHTPYPDLGGTPGQSSAYFDSVHTFDHGITIPMTIPTGFVAPLQGSDHTHPYGQFPPDHATGDFGLGLNGPQQQQQHHHAGVSSYIDNNGQHLPQSHPQVQQDGTYSGSGFGSGDASFDPYSLENFPTHPWQPHKWY
ncbi:hypothetical protein H0H93_010425, partial [Arthromyces matolae]